MSGWGDFSFFGGLFGTPNCMHLVGAWSSGELPRAGLREISPGIEACSIVSVRKPDSRTVGWSLDLQELIHILSVAKFTCASGIEGDCLEFGVFRGERFAAASYLSRKRDVAMRLCAFDSFTGLPQNQEVDSSGYKVYDAGRAPVTRRTF